MPKFAANLTMLYNELGFLERFDAAAAAGFRAVEFLFPYAFPAAEIRARLERNRLALVLHNLPAGNWEAGERGIACHPDRVGEFRDGVGKAIEYAKALRCRSSIASPALLRKGVARACRATDIGRQSRVRRRQAEGGRVRLLIEPINTYDIPVSSCRERGRRSTSSTPRAPTTSTSSTTSITCSAWKASSRNTIRKNLSRIGHLQLADNPGRNEPGTGEINYRYLFRTIDALGYDGWIGCEYKPATTTAAGLSWMDPGADAG
jgi:hydroxypyruvate isomerase